MTVEALKSARIPLSTYRLQFNSHFTFADARRIVTYLHALGLTDCYASSYLRAVPGSPHGYDVADPTRLNPEIGAYEDYRAWIRALAEHDMGHILDVVPNHMGIAKSSNPWWLDVLENGPSSRYARFFDIEWRPVKAELADKILIPILEESYGTALEHQDLRLEYREGAFTIRYRDNLLPIAPDTFASILGTELLPWRDAHDHGRAAEEVELIIAAARSLPPRSTRAPEEIARRALEKELLKRRLAALVEGCDEVRAFVEKTVCMLNGRPGEAASFDRLDQLLDEQSYRLADWRVASEEINYRRFFDVNELAALRMEDPVVFQEVHRFIFHLVEQHAATGFRVDHVDGLYAPGDYLRRLQAQAARALGSASDRPMYTVVEKILGPDETPPDEWPVHGTTGYEFAATIQGLFVDGRNAKALDDIYARFIQERISFADLAYRSKKLVMHETMSGDINSLGHQLSRLAERNRHFRDFTLYSLISALKEIIAGFPVYRAYVTEEGPVSARDEQSIRRAVASARRRAAGLPRLVFDFVERVLLKATSTRTPEECAQRACVIGKFQQLTSPVIAKAVEDTVFYRYSRLLSLNEVGQDPTRFGVVPADAHRWLAERQRRQPHGLSATATHDSKRGEDLRARLNVLSEIPGAWKAAVTRWRTVNRRHKVDVGGQPAPDRNEEYFLYQTLVGFWPFSWNDPETFERLHARLRQYVVKALREAKVHTNWLGPDEAYERAALKFVHALLDRSRPNPFLESFIPFQARVAELGIYNSLAQLLLKITAPGLPDFYQGTELWDLTLVDPDNRRPVDFALRQQLLDEVATAAERDLPALIADLLEHRADGRVKLFTMVRALHARARWREVYEQGEYVPLDTVGTRSACLFAFARRLDQRVAVTCVPRLVATLAPGPPQPPLGRDVWAETHVMMPSAGWPAVYRDMFTGTVLEAVPSGDGLLLPAATVFERFPIALLTSA